MLRGRVSFRSNVMGKGKFQIKCYGEEEVLDQVLWGRGSFRSNVREKGKFQIKWDGEG